MNGVETMANPVLLTWNATYGALETQMQLWRLVVSAFGDCLSHQARRARSTLFACDHVAKIRLP